MNPAIFKSFEPDPAGVILQTRFQHFTSHAKVHGLARDNGNGMIEILAVVASKKRKGQFRRFIADLEKHYRTICIWHVENEFLPAVLLRYGFKHELTVDEFGDRLEGFRWDAPASVVASTSTTPNSTAPLLR